MVSRNPHAHHSAKRMAEEDRGFGYGFFKKTSNVIRILRNAIASRHMRGFAMPTQVRSINMPSRRETRNQLQQNLPSPAESVQKNEWRSCISFFSEFESDFPGIEDLFLYPREIVGPGRRNHFASPSVESQIIFPPTIVFTILTSRILTRSMEKMSSLSRTISASLPGVMDPFSFSWNSAKAEPMVYASTASATV